MPAEQIEPGDLAQYIGSEPLLPQGAIRRCASIFPNPGWCSRCGKVPDGLLMAGVILPLYIDGFCRCSWRKLCGDPDAFRETEVRSHEPA